ncbi:MAG: chemotaxis-specific protein-glutamate methyltransferase CheB [Planctomycetota bacterium]
MPTYGVLVVDDSVAIRRLLKKLIAGDPGFRVVGESAHGEEVLDAIEEHRPDIITLDLEMPHVDGIEVLHRVRKRYGRLPVLVCSGHAEKGARKTLDALMAGATDFICKKPPPDTGLNTADYLRRELLGKMREILSHSWTHGVYEESASKPARERKTEPSANHREGQEAVQADTQEQSADYRTATPGIVVIGASTGGPAALGVVLEGLLSPQPLPILITQHMTKSFTGALAESLSRYAPAAVKEARPGTPPQAGDILIAPGDYHLDLAVVDGEVVTNLTKAPLENSCRPAVDVMFRAAARYYGAQVTAVVLTGMGQDGTEGARAVRAAGGKVLVQDHESSTVWGMPRSVQEAGLAHEVLTLKSIGPTIRRRIARSAKQAANAPA